MERNKLLSNIADLKTEHASRSRHSYEVPHHRSEEKIIRDPDEVVNEHDGGGTKCRGLDPEEGDVFDSSNVHNHHHHGGARSRGQSFGSKSPNRHRGDTHVSAQYGTDYHSDTQYEDEPSRYVPQVNDDASIYTEMESTILSYDDGPKQLEPESASSLQASSSNHFLKHNDSTQIMEEKRGIHAHRHSEQSIGEDESSAASEYQLVKVPGGEYYGMLNELSQKHGQGKMRYDNGNEYEGQWKYNKRDGKGTTKYASGNVYTGKYCSERCLDSHMEETPTCAFSLSVRYMEGRQAPRIRCFPHQKDRRYLPGELGTGPQVGSGRLRVRRRRD